MKLHKIYLIALLLPGSASSADFLYDAEVTAVKKITTQQQSTEQDASCFSSSPKEFRQLLNWDVGCQIPQMVDVTRYEVTYRVGAGEFTTIRDAAPGDSIKVKLNIVAAQHGFSS